MTFTVSVPATTANLGPGYDCLAMALQPRITVTRYPDREWSVRHEGPHRLDGGESDLVLTAARHASKSPLALTVQNEIPIGKGLGSSAAALVAGFAVGLHSSGEEVSPESVFRIAADLEGHAEQVAAAVYGGLILISADGEPLPMPIHPSIRVLVAVPDITLPTEEARAVVAKQQQLDVVVRSLSRVSALTAGLVTGRPDLLQWAGGDEIHEAPRAPMSPIVSDLIDMALKAGAWHAFRSGAGPSVVALTDESGVESVRDALLDTGVEVIDGPIDTDGLRTQDDSGLT